MHEVGLAAIIRGIECPFNTSELKEKVYQVVSQSAMTEYEIDLF